MNKKQIFLLVSILLNIILLTNIVLFFTTSVYTDLAMTTHSERFCIKLYNSSDQDQIEEEFPELIAFCESGYTFNPNR
ncbi:MAG: hypothetical protein AAGF07_00080 [Patescibacteria group bacterium]